MTIYTGGGDKGKTSLLSGERLPKAAPLVEAYGTLDELTAQLGVCRALISNHPSLGPLARIILDIQRDLFRAGMQLSSRPEHWPQLKSPICQEDIRALEQAIDGLEQGCGLPDFFVSPGQTLAGAGLHLARTICRRAERRTLTAVAGTSENGQNVEGAKGYETLLAYLNRLSDLIFSLSWAVETRMLIQEEVDCGNPA